MRKEIIFAIILGLAVGLLVVYGIYRSRQAPLSSDQNVNLTTSPSPLAEEVGNLVLHSPEDEIIVDKAEVAVTGTTDPQAFVVIFVNDVEHITTADASGNFSVNVTLETGSNVIIVYSLNEDGKKTIQERVVTFTTQSLEDTQEASSSADTSEASDE
ncbi:MAG TPA: hypothetical protein VF209_03210 [Patescibacteria group bacterium]